MPVETVPPRPKGRLSLAKGAFVIAAVLASAVVLWTRQSDDALLRVGSLPGAVVQVLFFALPSLALYLALARSPATVFLGGVLVFGLLVAPWWSAARDWHSTASLGPGLAGWLFLPILVMAVGLAPSVSRSVRQYWVTGSPRRRIVLVALTGLSVLASVVFFPLTLLAGVVIGAVLLPRRGERRMRAPKPLVFLIVLAGAGAAILAPLALIAGVAIPVVLLNIGGEGDPPPR